MTTPYQNFLFSELRAVQGEDYRYVNDILLLGFRMYPREQMREYLTCIDMEVLRTRLHLPAAEYLRLFWPPELFVRLPHERAVQGSNVTGRMLDLSDEEGAIVAWKEILSTRWSSYHKNIFPVLRLWEHWGWCQYRPPTEDELYRLGEFLAKNKGGRKHSNWNRVMGRIPCEHDPKPPVFTMKHPWMEEVRVRAEAFLKFHEEVEDVG